MSPRPTIFISAVSRELKSARQLVANTLHFLGYEPVWQDVFGTEQGDLREMLRGKIDESEGVVQLLGRCYGSEPPKPDKKFGRVSYTQYEALYARQRGKQVWYLALADDFPTDPVECEPAELTALQQAYRSGLDGGSLYHVLHTASAMEASVLKLRNDLAKLRRGVKRWAIAVSLALLTIVGLSACLLVGELGVSHELKKNSDAAARTEVALAEQRAAIDEYLRKTSQAAQAGGALTPKQRDAALEVVARSQHQPVEELRSKIDSFVKTVESDPSADQVDKSRAAQLLSQNNSAASNNAANKIAATRSASSDASAGFTAMEIDKPFDRYLLANHLLMEAAGAKIIRLPNGQSVVISVASTVLKDESPNERLRAERICRTKAFANVVQAKQGVHVFQCEKSTEDTTIVNDGGKEEGTSVSKLLAITETKVEGISRDMEVVGRWKSKDGDVFYLALGAICDQNGDPIPAAASATAP